MLPFTTAQLGHAPDAAGEGGHRARARDTASSPAFLAFAILLAALFLVCLLSAAARRLCSRFFSSGASPAAPHAAAVRRCTRGVGGVAMDPVEVAGSLPVRAYTGGGGVGEDEVCAVCLGELRAEEQVKAIPACGHVFHPPCIDRWLLLATAGGRASCPLCRRPAAALKPAAPAAIACGRQQQAAVAASIRGGRAASSSRRGGAGGSNRGGAGRRGAGAERPGGSNLRGI